jgi:tetrapyrrole methylase family protein/MazG family protein
LLEEAYEVLEALESGKSGDVCAELGDLLFHIVFLARIFEERGDFNISNVVETINKKMIRRHPHVFGQAHVSGSDEVRDRWHEMKIAEATDNDTAPNSFLDSVPKKLPALMQAYRISERAAKLGFDWPDIDGVIKKLDEELAEFKAALKRENSEKSGEMLGDLLFTTVNLGRFMRVHPEAALTRALSKFIKRFQAVEQLLREQGRTLESVSADEMDAIWQQGKTDKKILTGEKDD